MTVAVTGSSGLLGRAVVAELMTAGIDVLRLDLMDDGSGGTVIRDLRDATSLQGVFEGCRAIVHTAGIPRPQKHAPEELFSTNAMANFNCAESAVQAGVSMVVNISSISVLGYPFFVHPIRPPYLPIDEQQAPAPQDAYALSKQVGEDIWAAAVRRSSRPLQVINLRMPWIQTPASFIVDIPTAMVTGQDVDNLWAYIDSRDAAHAVRLALARDAQHDPGVQTMFVSARDNFAGRPTSDLATGAWPGLDCPILGEGSLFSTRRAAQTIGFQPAYTWREYPAI